MDRRLTIKTQAINKYRIYWLRITKLCNNNCLFCLDADNRSDFLIGMAKVEKEIIKARKSKYNKLVISGGEPTLHPKLFEIIKLARKNKFEKIQIITNGRRFADVKFALECIKVGINEFTLSLHSHDSKIQDKLYGGKGFGLQAQKGLANLVKFSKIAKIPIIINIDIVVNKLNIKSLLHTIKYYSQKFWIYEFDLLYPVPFGNASKNKDKIFFNTAKVDKYLRPVLNFYRKNQEYFIWLNRFPPEYLKGFEDLIQDPKKILNELEGNEDNINNLLHNKKQFSCRSESRCSLCHLHKFCQLLHEFYLPPIEKKLVKSNQLECKLSDWFNSQMALNQKKVITIKLDDLGDFNKSSEILNLLKNKWSKISNIGIGNFVVYDLPICLFKNKITIKNSSIHDLPEKAGFNKFLDYFFNRLNKIKADDCRYCRFYNFCDGVHINLIRRLGFKILKPIK